MPQSLKDHIKSLGSNANTKQKTDQIWVSCDGEYGVDKESLNGFEFYPSQGFSGYYYPYKNEDNYLSPLVAVRVIQPKGTKKSITTFSYSCTYFFFFSERYG